MFLVKHCGSPLHLREGKVALSHELQVVPSEHPRGFHPLDLMTTAFLDDSIMLVAVMKRSFWLWIYLFCWTNRVARDRILFLNILQSSTLA